MLERRAAESNLEDELEPKDLSTNETSIKRLWQASSKGCVHCGYSGHYGQTTMNEVLLMSEKVKSKIASGGSRDEVLKIATSEGYIPLGIDGLIKALRGLISVDEVLSSSI